MSPNDPRSRIARTYLQRLQPLPTLPADEIAEIPVRDFPYQAVIFDIYGTMLTSKAVNDEQRVSAIAEICVDVFPDITPPSQTHCYQIKNSFYQQLSHGYNSVKMRTGNATEVDYRNIWAQVLQRELSLDRVRHLQEIELFAFLYAISTHRSWPQPNLLTTIKGLSERNVPLGIISNSQFYTPIIVNHFLDCEITFSSFAIPYFNQALTFYSFQHGHVKPDNYFFTETKHVLADMNIAPDKTLYVGNDLLNDIDSANRNGFRSVLYAGDRTSCHMNHPTAEPHFVIKDLASIL